MTLLKVLLPIVLCAQVVSAEQSIQQSWADISYVPCEGVGLNGSGKVEARATVSQSGEALTISRLSVTSTHPHKSGFSASIDYTTSAGDVNSINLVEPWYPQMLESNAMVRVLPRNKTATRSGPDEQGAIDIKSVDGITISANILFLLDGGACASSFNKVWLLERE